MANGYKYVHIEDKENSAVTCFVAGAIYVVFPLAVAGKYFKSKCKREKIQVDQEIPLVDLSQGNMISIDDDYE